MDYVTFISDIIVSLAHARCAAPGGAKTSWPGEATAAWQLELWEVMTTTSWGRALGAGYSLLGRAQIESTLQPCMEPSIQAVER